MSSKVLSILVLVAAVCIIGILALQALELSYYSAAPSVWTN